MRDIMTEVCVHAKLFYIVNTSIKTSLCNMQVARKLAMVEADLERAEERAETGES